MNILKFTLLYPEKRHFLILFILLAALHIVFITNKSYTIREGEYIFLKNSDWDKYKLFISGQDKETKSEYIQHTETRYFDLLPIWTGYILIAGYLTVGVIYLLKITKGKHKSLSFGDELNRLNKRLEESIEAGNKKNEAYFKEKLMALEADKSSYYKAF